MTGRMRGLLWIGLVACLALVLAPVVAQAQEKPDPRVGWLVRGGDGQPAAGKGQSGPQGPAPQQGPANDECASATGPVGVPSTTSGTTVGATLDAAYGASGDCCYGNGTPGCGDTTCQDSVCSYDDFCCSTTWDSICASEAAADSNCSCLDPTCGTAVSAPNVWYTVTGTGNSMTASTCSSDSSGSADYDTKISVYCLGCDTPLCVDGNDDSPGCTDFTSTVTWCSQYDVEYLVMLHGFLDATGTFDLDVFDDGAVCSGAVLCQVEGACCDVVGAACFVATEAGCTAAGGTYMGDGTACFGEETYTSSPGSAIPDSDPVGITDTLTVPDSFTIGDVNVELNLTHTYIGDLIITIEHVPSGISQELWSQQCDVFDNIHATADDEGAETACAVVSAGPADQVFFPPDIAGQGLLSVFDGLDASGDWVLTVSDNFGGDTGTLDSWSLILENLDESICAPQQEEERAIPTLQGTGMAVLAVLLLGGAILVIRRRM